MLMSWNTYDLWKSILWNPYVVSIVAGVALLVLSGVMAGTCKRLGVRKRRNEAVKGIQNFFRDWEAEIRATDCDEDWRFARHEQRIRRMKDHLTLVGPNLPDQEWAEITTFIRSHEEDIEEWQLFFRREIPDFPRRFFLMDDNYKNFFEQAIKIKWLNPGKTKPIKQVNSR